jgi:FkbM family methyltransferase
MRTELKHAAKKLRDHPAVNPVITTGGKAVLRALGQDSQWMRKHVPRRGYVKLQLPNGEILRLWSEGEDFVSTQIFWAGAAGYEPETIPLWFRLAERAKVTVDVGAYVGYMTLLAALANRRGRVLALEPCPPTYERLMRNLSINGVGNVTCANLAAGAEQGTVPMYHIPDGFSSGASFNEEQASHDALGVTGEARVVCTEVPLRRLDDVLREQRIDKVDLMKIDTETTEPQVLEGASDMLARDHPHIVCEVLDRPELELPARLTEMLKPLGYRFYELVAGGVREHPCVPVPKAGNCLFSTWDESQIAPLHHWD